MKMGNCDPQKENKGYKWGGKNLKRQAMAIYLVFEGQVEVWLSKKEVKAFCWREHGKQKGRGIKASGWKEKLGLLPTSSSPLKTKQKHYAVVEPDQHPLSLEPSLKSHGFLPPFFPLPCLCLRPFKGACRLCCSPCQGRAIPAALKTLA